MIQPIGDSLMVSSAGLNPATTDKPPIPPATRVPAAADARSADTSTAGRESRLPGDKAQMGRSPSALEKALESVNSNLQAWSTGMRFEMDEDAQRLVVSIIDSATGEVLRTIPSDAVLKVAKMIVQLQGTGVDTRA